MTPMRVILAEDDVLLREGLASLLDALGLRRRRAGRRRAHSSSTWSATRAPDLVVVDIRMPPTHTTEGLDAARAIREEFPDIGILVLSAHVEVEHAMELLASGRGIGYLLKSRVTDVDEFIDTLQRIAEGAPSSTPRWCRSWSPPARRNDPLAALSAREREVLALMAEGRSNAGIARRLWVTEGTVEKHVRSILAKLRPPGDRRRSPPGARGRSPSSRLADLRPRARLRCRRRPRAGRGWRLADSSDLGRKPTAGLAAIRSAKSCSAWVEIRITGGGARRPRVEPLREVEAALGPEVDVEQRDVRAAAPAALDRVGSWSTPRRPP